MFSTQHYLTVNLILKNTKIKKMKIRFNIIYFFATIFLNINFSIYQEVRADELLQESVFQSEREIPIVKSVDIVVIGGTVPAVSAAISAAKAGAKVFLVAPRLYLGEDMCATLRLEINKNRKLITSLEKQIFGNELQTTPLKVKATLSKELQKADVEFVFGSYVTDILWDKFDVPSGVVIVNRAGRQAIVAKTIIDATDRAWVCRMAGAEAKFGMALKLNFRE